MDVIKFRKTFDRVCVYCGKHFTAKSTNAKFCGLNCKSRFHYVNKEGYTLEEAAELDRIKAEAKAKKAEKKRKGDNINKVLREYDGNYAEYQKKQSIELYARIKLEDL